MNNIGIFFSAIFLWTSSALLGQTSTSVADMLKGTWYLANSFKGTKDSLVYSRNSIAPHDWGDRIEFNPSNTFVDAYSAPCGNDSNIHRDVGTWQVSGQTVVTSIPISVDHGTKHTIATLTMDTLVLVRTP